MPYRMTYFVSGSSRTNHSSHPIGAACANEITRSGNIIPHYTPVPRLSERPRNPPPPSPDRAEITAIILALDHALTRYRTLRGQPALGLSIYSDSLSAVNFMTQGMFYWQAHNWRDPMTGLPVRDQDLLREAVELHNRVFREGGRGWVTYEWIPREENRAAQEGCERVLRNLEGTVLFEQQQQQRAREVRAVEDACLFEQEQRRLREITDRLNARWIERQQRDEEEEGRRGRGRLRFATAEEDRMM